jgi:hypothetical protein
MQSNGADIRFVNGLTSTATEFPFQIYGGLGTNVTQFFVQLDSLPVNTTRTIYMIFGNNQTTLSSIMEYPDFTTSLRSKILCNYVIYSFIFIVSSAQTLNGVQQYDYVEIGQVTISTGKDKTLTILGQIVIISGTLDGSKSITSLPSQGEGSSSSVAGSGGGYGGNGGDSSTGLQGGSSYGTFNGSDITCMYCDDGSFSFWLSNPYFFCLFL